MGEERGLIEKDGANKRLVSLPIQCTCTLVKYSKQKTEINAKQTAHSFYGARERWRYSNLLASNALLDLLEHNLHLLSDEVLHLSLELLELATNVVDLASGGFLGLLIVGL